MSNLISVNGIDLGEVSGDQRLSATTTDCVGVRLT
jgi:hypothetical protein